MRLPPHATFFTLRSPVQMTILVSALVIVGEIVLVGVAYSWLA